MIENFNDLLSLMAIVVVIIGILGAVIKSGYDKSKDDDDDFYQEIL